MASRTVDNRRSKLGNLLRSVDSMSAFEAHYLEGMADFLNNYLKTDDKLRLDFQEHFGTVGVDILEEWGKLSN